MTCIRLLLILVHMHSGATCGCQALLAQHQAENDLEHGVVSIGQALVQQKHKRVQSCCGQDEVPAGWQLHSQVVQSLYSIHGGRTAYTTIQGICQPPAATSPLLTHHPKMHSCICQLSALAAR